MKQKIGKVFSILSTVLVILLAVLLVSYIVMRICGISPYYVRFDDMGEEYPNGSMIFVKETDGLELQNGDVITYYMGGRTEMTSRICEIWEEEGIRMFRVQGDAHAQPDPEPVSSEDLIGTPVFQIPYLGHAYAYMQTTRGMYITVAVCAALLLLILLPQLLVDKEGRRR